MANGLQGVDGLARLRHSEGERAGVEDRIAIAELRRDLDLDRQPGPVLDGVFGHQAGVERRPARDHEHLVHVAKDVLGDAQLVEGQMARSVDPSRQRVPDRRGLLVDLLQHEVVEP